MKNNNLTDTDKTALLMVTFIILLSVVVMILCGISEI